MSRLHTIILAKLVVVNRAAVKKDKTVLLSISWTVYCQRLINCPANLRLLTFLLWCVCKKHSLVGKLGETSLPCECYTSTPANRRDSLEIARLGLELVVRFEVVLYLKKKKKKQPFASFISGFPFDEQSLLTFFSFGMCTDQDCYHCNKYTEHFEGVICFLHLEY